MSTGAQHLRDYVAAIQRNVVNGVATEHTHRSALEAFLEEFANGIDAINEPRRIECGAPDFTVSRRTGHGPLTLGYVEAKDVGTDLGAIERDGERASPSSRDGQQLKRYRGALPSLVLTDYLEFRWYVDGQRRSGARLASVDVRGRLVPDRDGESAVLQLLADFLAHQPAAIARPKEFAERMARLTHLIRDVVVEAFEKDRASQSLRGLRDAFAEVLIPDLSVHDFADMFAQTLSYGLFAAQVEHDSSRGPFRRQDAAQEIPRTNPFLRRLFATIAGPDLDDEPFVGLVDDLAQLLASTDIGAVLADFGKREARTDPVMHFYETFLAAYDPALREKRGVYYTPEPVVSYIVRSVDYLLKTRFGCTDGLADTAVISYPVKDDGKERTEQAPKVLILDPACGTGTFLYSVVDLIRGEFMRQGNAGKWSGYVTEALLPRLFGFELLMAPYAMSHLKLGMQLAARDLPQEQRCDWAYDFTTGERLGIYLTNTLEEAVKRSQMLMGQFISEEANAAADIKREKPIMVVLGNPPYSGHSANKGPWIGALVRDYYCVDGRPLGERNPKWLQDDYVKFIRFGQWRIQQTGHGVLAFITNNGYLDNPTFRGMRQQLMDAFTDIYILDLHGNTKKRERAPDGSQDENVFDIQQGVAIGIFLKEAGKEGPARVHHAHLWFTRESKYAWLSDSNLATTDWHLLKPSTPFYLFTPYEVQVRQEWELLPSLAKVMPVHSMGMNTHRDSLVVAFTRGDLEQNIRRFRSEEVADSTFGDLFKQASLGVVAARQAVRQEPSIEQRFLTCLYRPFDFRSLFYHPAVVDRPRHEVNRHMLSDNLSLVTTRYTIEPFSALVSRVICGQHKVNGPYSGSLFFPMYLYPEGLSEPTAQRDLSGLSPWPEGKNGRRPNLDPEFVKELVRRLGLAFVTDGHGDLVKTFGPEDVLGYIYAVFHSPSYRQRYAEFLKMDFPRVPLTADLDLFRALAQKGHELVSLHLMEWPALRQHITRYPVPGDNVVERGHPRYLAPGEPEPGTGKPLAQGRVYISKDNPKAGKRGQYIEGIPSEVWEFQVGGYQVCEKWLKDRVGRALTNADLEHYERTVMALKETMGLMAEIDETIEAHGGWPLR